MAAPRSARSRTKGPWRPLGARGQRASRPHPGDKTLAAERASWPQSHAKSREVQRLTSRRLFKETRIWTLMEDIVQSILATIPSRAKFSGRYLGYTTFSSVSIGLVCGQIGAVLQFGPLLPFIGGAWVGYSVACVSFWQLEAIRALDYIRRYPRLVEHQLQIEFAPLADFNEREPIGQWVHGGGMLGRLGRLSWAVLAAQSCTPSVKQIQEAERQRVVESCQPQTGDDDAASS